MRANALARSKLAGVAPAGSSSCRCQRSRLITRVRSATRSSRWPPGGGSRVGRHRDGRPADRVLAGPHVRSRERLWVGLAERAGAVPSMGYQLRRHPHDLFAGCEEVPFQSSAQVPAVLDRPEPVLIIMLSRPCQQPEMVVASGAIVLTGICLSTVSAFTGVWERLCA